MNILIVDDEILAIENVENALKNISVPDTRGRNVFRAFNINDAKSIIATEILISYFAILRCRTGMELTWCAGSMKADIIWNVL